MVALGTKAAHFTLPDAVSGKTISLAECSKAAGLLVMFICNHCPFVKHVRAELAALGKEYLAKGIGVVAISANDVQNYPEDAPELMAEEAREAGYTFPYLYDESQEVARAYHAACTPDFFLYDNNLSLVYRGQLDDSRPGNGVPVSGRDLRAALEALVSGSSVSQEQKPSMGCNIKWKE